MKEVIEMTDMKDQIETIEMIEAGMKDETETIISQVVIRQVVIVMEIVKENPQVYFFVIF